MVSLRNKMLFWCYFRAAFLQRRSREVLDNDELQVNSHNTSIIPSNTGPRAFLTDNKFTTDRSFVLYFDLMQNKVLLTYFYRGWHLFHFKLDVTSLLLLFIT